MLLATIVIFVIAITHFGIVDVVVAAVIAMTSMYHGYTQFCCYRLFYRLHDCYRYCIILLLLMLLLLLLLLLRLLQQRRKRQASQAARTLLPSAGSRAKSTAGSPRHLQIMGTSPAPTPSGSFSINEDPQRARLWPL